MAVIPGCLLCGEFVPPTNLISASLVSSLAPRLRTHMSSAPSLINRTSSISSSLIAIRFIEISDVPAILNHMNEMDISYLSLCLI